MRQVILDTETTGLEPAKGHRVVEIGLVEILHRRRTGRVFHTYLNPQRDSDPGALQKHGLGTDFLQDKPLFAQVLTPFLDFVQEAELIIHNAPFDQGFLNHELARLNQPPLERCCAKITDTLTMARELHPGKRNTLDALCDRYGVDRSAREFHGALLDAELLSEVYLAMTRGQDSLLMDPVPTADGQLVRQASGRGPHSGLRIQYASLEEIDQHLQQLENLQKASRGQCNWLALHTES